MVDFSLGNNSENCFCLRENSLQNMYSAFNNAAIAKMLMKSIHRVRVKEALGVCAHVAILLSSDHGM